MGKRVLVTGASDRLGSRLARALEEHPLVERIVGLETGAASSSGGKLASYKADIRDEFLLRSIMEDEAVDTVFHLAHADSSPRDEVRAREAHVSGTLAVLEAANKSSTARRLLIAGSTLAYGARRRNPERIPEEQALRAWSPRFAAHKRLMEDELAQSLPQVRKSLGVAVLRLCPMAGGPLLGELCARPRIWAPLFRRGGLQVLAESDLANVLLRAMEAPDLRGAFNVAPDDAMTLAQLAQALGKPCLPVPYSALWLALFLKKRLFGGGGLDETAVGYLAHPVAASNDKIKRTLGVKFEKNSLAALLEHAQTSASPDSETAPVA